ncbi:putative glucose-6-phosphate dehydrogenase (NADP(+)) [Helianthus annuus]|nr:putative glucose-6-phosphate dehydrogenase (NADP(+)) [Helianthus annuus]
MLHRFSSSSLKPTIDIVNLSPALSALHVFDEMPDSTEHGIAIEVHATNDEEVLEIDTDSLDFVNESLGVKDAQMVTLAYNFGLQSVAPSINIVLADNSIQNDMVETNDYVVDPMVASIDKTSFAWKPGLIEHLVQVFPWKSIVTVVCTNKLIFRSSTMVIDSPAMILDPPLVIAQIVQPYEPSIWVFWTAQPAVTHFKKYNYLQAVRGVHKDRNNNVVLKFQVGDKHIRWKGGALPIIHVLDALDMMFDVWDMYDHSNSQFYILIEIGHDQFTWDTQCNSAPKLIVLDVDPEPPDPYFARVYALLDQFTLSARHIIQLTKASFANLLDRLSSESDDTLNICSLTSEPENATLTSAPMQTAAKWNISTLGIFLGPVSIGTLQVYRDVTAGPLLYGVNKWLSDIDSLDIPNFDWKPGWRYGSVGKLRAAPNRHLLLENIRMAEFYALAFGSFTQLVSNFLATLLGRYQVKSELELLSFIFTQPQAYAKAKRHIITFCKDETKHCLLRRLEDDLFLDLLTVKTEVISILVGVLHSMLVQSKHLDTTSMHLFEVWIDFVTLFSADYIANNSSHTMEFGYAKKEEYKKDSQYTFSNLANHDKVRILIYANRVRLCGLVETHSQKTNLDSDCTPLIGRWNANAVCRVGMVSIVTGLDLIVFSITLSYQMAQVLTCYIEPINGSTSFYGSFVFGHICMEGHGQLWNALKFHQRVVGAFRWGLVGDFNVIRVLDDSLFGSTVLHSSMTKFREIISDVEFDDLVLTAAIRVQIRHVLATRYTNTIQVDFDPTTSALVLRVQPSEVICLLNNSTVLGLELRFNNSTLNLLYVSIRLRYNGIKEESTISTHHDNLKATCFLPEPTRDMQCHGVVPSFLLEAGVVFKPPPEPPPTSTHTHCSTLLPTRAPVLALITIPLLARLVP